MRNLSLLLAVPLLVACGKVVGDPQPNQQPAGAAGDAPAGRAAPAAGHASGGIGGSTPTPPPARDGGTAPRTDAGMRPPQPAADGGSEDDAGSAQQTLCDGSEALRLAYVVSGGFVAQTFGFTNPRGAASLGIDGKCRYFVDDDYMRGIISGTLTPAEAEQLSAELHWNDLDAWADYGLAKDAACPDAGVVGLMKAKASAGCSCGCDPAAPSGLGNALQSASQWVLKLKAAGKPLEGPVSAMITESSIGKPPRQPEFAWPLSRPIGSIANLVVDLADSRLFMGTVPWARFDDPAEFTKLRELRRASLSSNAFPSQAVLLRDNGKDYDLYVRDELPAETERAWKELRATLPSR